MQIEIPQVMVPSMNATHAEEVEVLSELAAALAEGDEARIKAAANALAEHVEEHFSREEDLMRTHHFPPYPVHKAEHDRMRMIVREKCAGWTTEEGRAALRRFVEEEFPGWLAEHVSTLDTVTAHFLSMHGVE